MELVLALAIGVLMASGVWLILRPRTFQVAIGLSLVSYAVNLFIFSIGRLRTDAPPVLESGLDVQAAQYHRSRAAGTGADRHRHRFRHDGAFPCRAACLARVDPNRPC